MSINVFSILSGSLIQSKITDVCLYGNMKVSIKPLKEDAVEEGEEVDSTEKCFCIFKSDTFKSLNCLVMFIFKEEKQLVLLETWNNTYAFFPQMAPWYQFRQVLKYFFLVPMTCWSAQTLGLMRIKGEHLCFVFFFFLDLYYTVLEGDLFPFQHSNTQKKNNALIHSTKWGKALIIR